MYLCHGIDAAVLGHGLAALGAIPMPLGIGMALGPVLCPCGMGRLRSCRSAQALAWSALLSLCDSMFDCSSMNLQCVDSCALVQERDSRDGDSNDK